MIDPLSELAIVHGTDKVGLHDYTPNYHRLFEPFRDRPLRLLEIGVGGYADEDRGGQSLATWRDYFPKAEITGIDLQKKSLELGPRVRILQGSQIDLEFLDGTVAERGPFDLIVDDGSHRNEHVVTTFGQLWPTLRPGGIYVVEDVQTAFMPRFGGSLTLTAPNTVGLFAGLLAALIAGSDDAAEIAGIERFHNMVALHKVGGDSASRLASRTRSEVRQSLEASADAEAALRATVAGMPDGSDLTLDRDQCIALAPLLDRLFAQIDHREIVVTSPRAEIDPLALRIRGIEVTPTGAVLRVDTNDYPSNFAFDYTHPRAEATIAEMERVLERSDSENGLLHLASILTARDGRAGARHWLARLDEIGATARNFFLMAGGLAQGDRDLPRAEALFGRGLERFPGDSMFAFNLSGVLLVQGKAEEAASVIAGALETNPRDVSLHLQMARAMGKLSEHTIAIRHASMALALSAQPRRAQCLLALADAQMQASQADAAAVTLAELVEGDSRFAPKGWRLLSNARKHLGDIDGARAAAEAAVALSPDTREYRDWRDALSA